MVEDKPEGLYYFRAVVNKKMAKEVIEGLDKGTWEPIAIQSKVCRMIQYYKKMPEFLMELRRILIEKCDSIGFKNIDFNKCLVNNYKAGEGIGGHIDDFRAGEVIACFTFGAGADIKFTLEGKEPYSLFTDPGSLYLMTGDCRYKWKHEMPKRKFDMVEGMKTPRGRRISVTFREFTQI